MTTPSGQQSPEQLSPYKSDQDHADSPELREFMSRVEATLVSGFDELLSDATKHCQKNLLIIASIVLLLATHAIEIKAVKALEWEVAIKRSALEIAIALCAYFETLVSIRSYTDWKRYYLETSIANLDAKELGYQRIRDGDLRPFELSAEGLQAKRDYRRQTTKGVNRSGSGVKGASSSTAEPSSGGEPSEADLQKAEETLNAKRLDYDLRLRATQKKVEWFDTVFPAFDRSRKLRFVIEVAFPICFGAFALAIGLSHK